MSAPGQEPRYYRPSGKVPAAGLLLVLAGGTAGSIPLALAYAAACRYSVSWAKDLGVSFNPILAAALAMLVGLGVAGLCRLGRVRNDRFSAAAALLLGAVTLYAAWVWFAWLHGGRRAFALAPGDLLKAARRIAGEVPWALPADPAGLPRWGYYAVWAAEGLLFLLVPPIFALVSRVPFCERCGEWMERHNDAARLEPVAPELLRKMLEEGLYEGVNLLERRRSGSGDYISITLFSCRAGCERCYLTAWYESAGEKGREASRLILANIAIPRRLAEALQGPAPKEE